MSTYIYVGPRVFIIYIRFYKRRTKELSEQTVNPCTSQAKQPRYRNLWRMNHITGVSK